MPDDEWLAAEYALGVLAGDARDAPRAAWRASRLSHAWSRPGNERLTPWAGEIDEVAPPAHVWDAIAANCPARRAAVAPGLWQSLAFWRGLALRAAPSPPPASVR